MMVLGIDPGPTQSGWAILGTAPSVNGYTVHDSGVDDNHDLLTWVKHGQRCDILAIETMLVNYGSKVGPSVMDTMRWAGKFEQHWLDQGRDADSVRLISRQDVKVALRCAITAGNGDVRQALIELIGEPGRKKAPGPTYGVTSHAWQALAVAVAAARNAPPARQAAAGSTIAAGAAP
jgi:Holliday junction resolvasome RuvABC endonuclease subunit